MLQQSSGGGLSLWVNAASCILGRHENKTSWNTETTLFSCLETLRQWVMNANTSAVKIHMNIVLTRLNPLLSIKLYAILCCPLCKLKTQFTQQIFTFTGVLLCEQHSSSTLPWMSAAKKTSPYKKSLRQDETPPTAWIVQQVTKAFFWWASASGGLCVRRKCKCSTAALLNGLSRPVFYSERIQFMLSGHKNMHGTIWFSSALNLYCEASLVAWAKAPVLWCLATYGGWHARWVSC